MDFARDGKAAIKEILAGDADGSLTLGNLTERLVGIFGDGIRDRKAEVRTAFEAVVLEIERDAVTSDSSSDSEDDFDPAMGAAAMTQRALPFYGHGAPPLTA